MACSAVGTGWRTACSSGCISRSCSPWCSRAEYRGEPARRTVSSSAEAGRVGVDFVVRALQVALNQEAIVLGVVDRGLVVVTRERLYRVQRLPQREREELGPLAHVAAEHPCSAVARRLGVAGDPRVL